jgi:hypothetical protein
VLARVAALIGGGQVIRMRVSHSGTCPLFSAAASSTAASASAPAPDGDVDVMFARKYIEIN